MSGSGHVVSRDVSVSSSVTRVSACCGFRVHLSTGDPSITLTGDDNVLDQIEVAHTATDKVSIRYADEHRQIDPSQPVDVDVTLSGVTAIAGSGRSIWTTTPLEGDDLAVTLRGGSTLDVARFHGSSATVKLSAASRAQLRGSLIDQTVDVGGSSRYDAADLYSRTASLVVTGGSVAAVRVIDTLDVTASGGSTVQYLGDPEVTKHLTGGSTLESLPR